MWCVLPSGILNPLMFGSLILLFYFVLHVLGLHQTPFTPHVKNKTPEKTHKDQLSTKRTQTFTN